MKQIIVNLEYSEFRKIMKVRFKSEILPLSILESAEHALHYWFPRYRPLHP